MRRILSVALAAVVVLASGLVLAQMTPMAGGMRGGQMGLHMGPGMMGGGMMGGGPGPADCPGMGATGTTQAQVTEERAKALAQEYADRHLKGFTVDKVLPFTAMHGTAYAVELKGPGDEVRTFHINPWGNVMPFGGPWRRAG